MQRPTINTLNIKKRRIYPLVVQKVKNVVCSAGNESEGGACMSAKVERQKKKNYLVYSEILRANDEQLA